MCIEFYQEQTLVKYEMVHAIGPLTMDLMVLLSKSIEILEWKLYHEVHLKKSVSGEDLALMIQFFPPNFMNSKPIK